MIEQPYGVAIFCDDIRREASGKTTLIGCYQGEMVFLVPAPATLPMFSVYVNMRIPFSIDVKNIRVEISLETDGKDPVLLGKQESDLSTESIIDLTKKDEDQGVGSKIMMVNIPFQWAGVIFTGESQIKARGFINGGSEIKLGTLRVLFKKPEEVDTIVLGNAAMAEWEKMSEKEY